MRLHHSPTFSKQVGIVPAVVYDFIVGWIYTNAQKKRKTAFADGKWWTYNTTTYYANELGISERTFQRAISVLAKEDYLQMTHKGRQHELWLCLGTKMPNVPVDELPFDGKYSVFCNSSDNLTGLTPSSSDNLTGLTPSSSDNLSVSSDKLSELDANAPSSGAASEPPKQLNKQLNLKDSNNNKDIRKISQKEEDKKTNEENKNTLTPMSGIIDTLLGNLKGSPVVVDDNLSVVLGVDFNDPSTHDKIVTLGVSLNVEQETMANLIKKHGLPAVAKQLVNLNYQQKVSPASNPAGWLVTAVARNYALNQQALDCVKTQKQKQKERAEYQAMVARMNAEKAEEEKRQKEEFHKNGPDFEGMSDVILGVWLRKDKSGFIEKKYRAFLAGKGIPARKAR